MPSLVAAMPRVFRVQRLAGVLEDQSVLGVTLFISDLLMHKPTKGQLEMTRDR